MAGDYWWHPFGSTFVCPALVIVIKMAITSEQVCTILRHCYRLISRARRYLYGMLSADVNINDLRYFFHHDLACEGLTKISRALLLS